MALAAQGFVERAPARRVGIAQVRRVASRLKVIQIDPINVLVRSQYLPVFSRIGPYPMGALDNLAYQRHELFEYAGHEWSLLPLGLHPLMRWRMEAYFNDPRWTRDLPRSYVETVLTEVGERGPFTPAELSAPGRRSTRFEAAPGKRVLTWLTQSGRVAVAGRRGLQQVYDLADRVIPPEVLAAATPERDEARRALIVIAARALGVGTARDLATYFSIGLGVSGFSERTAYPKSIPVSRLAADLADEGRLVPVRVEGRRDPAYLHPSAAAPADVHARALLSPFDSLIWERDRTERLFAFRYRSEVYTPEPKRQYGYYVLPFLLGEYLVARVDLKTDRRAGTLVVSGAFGEPGAEGKHVASELGEELRRMASWLDLERIRVGDRGNLARRLQRDLPP
ncbi:MAG: winged helix-turn-helix domain-containing protein [Actinomycetota bacterium]